MDDAVTSRQAECPAIRSPRATRRGWMLAALGLVAVMAGNGAEARDPGGAGTAPIVVRDDRGVEHRFAAPPQRIVTLMPSLTETAWVLKAGPRLVGVDRFSNWPPQIAALPRLGGLEDAHIEAITRLQPDVVLASTAARSLDRLEALGLRVLRLKSNTHADVRRSLILVATLLGDPSRGRQAWTQIEHDIEAAARRVPRSMRGQRVYFEVNGGPHAAGTSSFIGETLTRLGMSNIVPPELGPFPKLNPEFVVRAAPDIIMGIDHELRDLVQRPGWDTLQAVRRHRLCGFATTQHDILVRPGPRMGEAAAALADCLVGLAASASP